MWFFYRNRKFIYLLLLLFLIGCFSYKYFKERFSLYYYDLSHENPFVTEAKDISAILAEYPVLSYSQLDRDYLEYTHSGQDKFRPMLSKGKFRLIPKEDIHRRIVDDIRISAFICKDKQHKGVPEGKIIWLVNEKLLLKTLEIMDSLDIRGYNRYAFHINSGHRHPKQNSRIGGANRSKHIAGEAIDISVGDINKDGYANQKDKAILYNLLDRYIIANKGGIGRYPGTMNLHYDIRGTRARWDSY